MAATPLFKLSSDEGPPSGGNRSSTRQTARMARSLAIPVRSKVNLNPPPQGEYQADFLKRITAQETRATKRPASLSIEQHAARRKQLQCICFIKQKSADETEVNIGGVLGIWKRCCEANRLGEWRPTIENLRREMTVDFSLYVWKISRIKSWARRRSYGTSVFPAEWHRVQLAGRYPLLSYTGARPAEVVDNQKRPKVKEDEKVEYADPVIELYIPERTWLVEILYYQPADLTDEEIFQLRVETIDNQVALYDKREAVKRDRVWVQAQAEPPVKRPSPEPDPVYAAHGPNPMP
ncbi:hypothetical protein DL766_005139 [Monosporascus sp. MC13-8B]|uniref:Uncharacterized protein n=1 Tax=Monosporascus cannonballus TaxID=155416 RepID=A0ABY0HD09_9PEZI|nr:hypothetical protein DL762_003007 [Monosporascus cannonballus]RYO96093.1 hypothetical protein DL763_003383 [Monosporascus cannonballus]RYP29940.1 hypothetical protein DL766_005139 [Monosporascus sp. MC13-8B]